jgi:hypothetical protein
MWEFRSLYIVILALIQSRQSFHEFEIIDSFTRSNRFIYSVWSSSIKAHLRASWSDFIFVTLLRRRWLSHFVFVFVDYAQISNNDRNDDLFEVIAWRSISIWSWLSNEELSFECNSSSSRFADKMCIVKSRHLIIRVIFIKCLRETW